MESEVQRLVKKTWKKFQSTPPTERLLIAVSGIPGSGKTTLAAKVVTGLNALFKSASPSLAPIASFVPMDGYHLSREQLSAMADPVHAHARRGAAFTFDGAAFLELVRTLRQPLNETSGVVYAPSFDHALKDPKADDIAIAAETRILVFEGNYLSLDREPWKEAAGLMDELWFVEVGFEVARRRLVPRHVKAGIAVDEADADKRVRENDLVNGEEIVKNRLECHEVIVSREDDEWGPERQGVKE